MSAAKDGRQWKCQFYEAWEKDFKQQKQKELEVSFEQFVEIYLADMQNRLRESTMRNKRFLFMTQITPYFKKKKMCEIKTVDIRQWQNELIQKGYTQTYMKSINNQLSAVFNYAVKYYDQKENPSRKAGSIGKSHANRVSFWTQEEFMRFLPSVNKKKAVRTAFLLLYWTGIRIGELLALNYGDIDFNRKMISITKSCQRIDGRDLITPPKTPKSNREVTIPSFLVETLKDYCAFTGIREPGKRLFLFTKSYMEHEIIRGAKETGVKRIRLHDLRHSHASLLVELGYQPLAIAERLGHERVETTMNTYSHLYPNKQKELAEHLDALHEKL